MNETVSGKPGAVQFRASGSNDPVDHLKVQNAAMETFFKTNPLSENTFSPAGQCKAELIWRHSWQTRRAVEIAIFEYINGLYNPRRRHSALGWKSPLAFEWIAA